jgi:hypothetical protein
MVYLDDEFEKIYQTMTMSQKYDVPYWCDECHILYNTGCCHYFVGCTHDDFNAKLIKSFKYNGVLYLNKTPVFKSFSDYVKTRELYEFTWICTCKGTYPDCGVYKKKSKTPCELLTKRLESNSSFSTVSTTSSS